VDTDRLYREVGEAIQVAQMLEASLRALVTVLNRRFDAHIDEQQIILAEDRHTLGRLIEQFKTQAELNDDFVSLLAEALEARNYIAHEFFIRHLSALSDEAAYVPALRILDERTKKIVAAAGVVSGFAKKFAERFGADVVIRQDI
jgi:hypothetical protein